MKRSMANKSMTRNEGGGGVIRRMCKADSECLRSSILGCTQSFALLVKTLVESLLECSGCILPESTGKKRGQNSRSDSGHVKVLLDLSRLCCRIESEGFGAEPRALLEDERLKILAHFATISIVTRPSGSPETREVLWRSGELVGVRQSKDILNCYGCRVVVKDILAKIPVRRKMLLDTPASKHDLMVRSELLPMVLSNNSHLSFSLATWTNASKKEQEVFTLRQNSSVALALAAAFGLDQSNLTRVQVTGASGGWAEAELYYLEDWRSQQKCLFELVMFNDKVVDCDDVASRLRLLAQTTLLRDDSLDERRHQRRGRKFSFLLSIKFQETEDRRQDGESLSFASEFPSRAINGALVTLTGLVLEKERKQQKPHEIKRNGSNVSSKRGKLAFKIRKRRPEMAEWTKQGSKNWFSGGQFTSFPGACECCQFSSDGQAAEPPQEKKGTSASLDSHRRRRSSSSSSILDLNDLAFLGNDLVPRELSRGTLKGCTSLGQVDKKFVVSLSGSTLLLFDQHAADERIRLERLTFSTVGKLKEGDEDCSFKCAPTICFHATLEELSVLHAYGDRLRSWGWEIEENQTNNSVLIVSRIPCIDGRKLTIPDLREYMEQLHATSGSKAMPKAMAYVLGSRACRSAIKFGDRLTPEQCAALIHDIKETAMPFQCAHGRPTCAPLIDLSKLKSVENMLQKKRLRPDNSARKIVSLRELKRRRNSSR